MTRAYSLLLFLLCGPSLLAQEARFFPQVGDGTFADIRFQTSIILVNTGGPTSATLDFFDSTGAALDLTLQTADGLLGPDSQFTIALGSGESFSAQTPGTGSLQVGYGRLAAPAAVGGTAVFTRSDVPSGTILYEAGVPASSTLQNFSLFVDSLGDKDTGLAIVFPPSDAQPLANTDLTLRLYDKLFNLVATTALPLNVGSHLPQFIFQFFSDVGQQAQEMEGVVTVESTQPVAAVTLRQNDIPGRDFPLDVPTLTTFPVIPGSAVAAQTQGRFAWVGADQIQTTLDLTLGSRVGIGVIYRLYAKGELVAEQVHSLVTSEGSTHRLRVADDARRIDRVVAQLIFAGGELGPSFDLDR